MYANIRGVKGKRSSLIEQIESEAPHLFLLTETLLPANTLIHIMGYTFFGRARSDRKGGGIGILESDENALLSSSYMHTYKGRRVPLL